MRVAFFGSTQFSCMILGALLESRHEVVAAVTQPDQPKGRKLTFCPTEVCCEADALELPVLKPEQVKSNPEFRRELMAYRPEAFMVASYGQIISRKVLELTEWPLNVHPSLLPKLRGAAPVRGALLAGHTQTGVCIMRMTPRLDDGDVLLCEELAIAPDWNFGQLKLELTTIGGELAVAALDAAEAGSATFTPQDHSQATYSSMFTREDTCIDWSRPAAELHNFIRAWDPDIGALTSLPDGRRLKIWQASAEEPPSTVLTPPNLGTGQVLARTTKALWITTGQGALKLSSVQPENKQRMDAAAFLAGSKLALGAQLGAKPGAR